MFRGPHSPSRAVRQGLRKLRYAGNGYARTNSDQRASPPQDLGERLPWTKTKSKPSESKPRPKRETERERERERETKRERFEG
ncbi:hypothetical protein LX32DRAFT_637373 [Colletotrichum zoysiae]|uniref:Uncharacterized protein n=1 Tax=Colletotrichum zoysiae TaxID=1216348 RepID=A0AAD9HN81_9PEZI|nr:hypothetical protein LX32DRAFT_637373 [Colletotrichum zoysiae]